MASNDLQNRFAERIKKRKEDMAKSTAVGDDSSPSPTPSATSDNMSRFKERITERRSKMGMDVEVDDSFISSFITDANDYLENAHSSYNGLGYSNAASTYASMAESVVGLRSRSGAIARYLKKNKDSLEPAYYDELSSILESFGKSATEYQKAFYDADKFYSQFESEDAYNTWKSREEFISAYLEDPEKAMETMEYDDSWIKEIQSMEAQKEYYDTWGHYADAEDFGQVTSAGKDFYYKDFGSKKKHRGSGARRRGTYTIDNYRAAAMALYEHNGGELDSSEAFKYSDQINIYRNMDNDEFQLLSYFIEKDKAEGTNLAEQYVDAMDETLKNRRGQEIATNVDNINIPVIEDIAKLGTGFASGIVNAYSGMAQYVSGEKLPTDVSQYANYYISESLDGFAGYAHEAATTIGNMAPSILVSAALGPAGPATGAAAMGWSAAGNAYGQALDWGYDQSQARVYGTIVGALEGGLQYLLGGITKLSGVKGGKVLSKIDAIDKAAFRIAAKLGWENVKEIGEEELQNFLEPLVRTIVLGEEYDAPTAAELFETAIVTLLSTTAMEGPGTIMGDISESKYYKNEYGEFQTDLVDQALEGGEFASQLAQKYKGILDSGNDLSGHQLGRLVEANEQQFYAEDMANIQKAAANRLTELGETGDVQAIGKALAKQAAGEKLSRAEQQIIAGSKYGQRVANELNTKNIQSGGYASGWAEQLNTNRINAQEYGRILEAAQQPQEAAETTGEQVNADGQNVAQQSHAAPAGAVNAVNADSNANSVLDNAKTSDKRYEQATGKESLQVAEDGVSRQVSTGKEVTPQKIVSIEGGKVMIQTDNGTVAADDIEFGTKDTDLLWRSAAQFQGINTAGANGIIRAYRGGDNVATYLHGAAQEFRNGYYNMESGGEYADKLTPSQREIIYELGQKAAGENIANAQAVAKNATTTNKISNKTATASKSEMVGTVHFERKGRTFDSKRETALKTMEQLSKALGVEFYVYESYVNEAGKRVYKDANGNEVHAPNGFYDPKDESIHIDLNAGADGKGTMLFTIAHELTHFIRQWSPAKFKVLANFLIKQYGEEGVSVNALVDAQIKKANDYGRELSWDEAYEEVVADSMEAMLTDGNVVQMMAELKQQDKTLWQKICDWFKDLAADLKALVDAYKGVKPDSYEGKMVAQMQDVIVTLESLYADALADAGENYQGAKAEKNTTQEGGVKYSIRETTDGRFVAVVESDILEDIDTSVWNQEKKRKAQAAASNALKQFSGGIVVNGVTRVVNRTSRREYTRSRDTARLYRADTEIFADKMRSADVADDIVIAASNWNRDGGLLHPRTDDFVDFDHGQTLIMSGSAKYSAEVVVGITSDGTAVFYDVVDMSPAEFEIKNTEPHSTATTNESIGDMIGGSADSNVAQNNNEVKHVSAEAMDLNVDEQTESVAPGVLFSERTWTESDYVQERDKASKEIAKAIGVSEKKAASYIDSVNSIAKMIADDRVRLDYFSSPGRSSFIGNVEYGGSFDFSTLCKKRRLLTGTFTAIQKALPNTALTADEILDILNRMKNAGLEVSCGLCYVEGSRGNMGQFAKEFLKLYKQYFPDAWQPNMADVNTPDGIEWVRINHPECYEQYEYFWNHYGTLQPGDKNLFASQQKPKLYQLHTEYKGEILERFRDDDNVEEKNLNGGIRLQSFSDFEIVHLIDTMQIIMDMSRVGLAGQAYTKVPDFAWALGDTGLKINLSLIAKGVDENGMLIFDDVEGIPIDEAMKLRDRYSKNVGTIMVAFNDEQLLAAMADDRVDFIIPFHRSQWKKSQYEAMGLPAKTKDYTYMQNEKFIKPQYYEYRGRMVKDRATNYMPNEYWDFSKSGKENAEVYLQMCARNNKRPKFYKLLQNNGDGSYSLKADGSTDGYWKLLIDFKMYDNSGNGSPQMPVKPDFNMDEATRMLNEYSGGHNNFPVAQGIADSFVKEYKESHKNAKFSERDPELERVNRVLEKENAELKYDISYLKELLKLQKKVTGGTKFTKSSVEASAGQLMKYANAKGDKAELVKLLNSLYEYIAKGKELTWDGVVEMAQPAVEWLQSHVNMTEKDAYAYDQELVGQDLLRQVYDSYWNVSTLYTVADKAQKEINKLKYEHSKRMGNLRKFHSEKTAQLKSEHREALQKVKQEERKRSEKKLQELSDRYQESRKKNAENRRKTEMRRKIRRTIMDLKKILNQGDKKRNVKEDMKDLVAEALKSADILFTDNYGNEDMIRYGVGTELTEQEAKYMAEAQDILAQIEGAGTIQERQEAESRLQGKLDYRMGKLKDVFVREKARLNKTKVSEVLGSLADAYASLEKSEYSYVSGAFDENVHQYLTKLKADVGGTIIKDMSLNQLDELYKAYTMVLTTVRNANKMFAANMKQTREQLGSQTIHEVKQAGGEHGLWLPGEDKINAFSWNNQKPVYAFERIGSATLTRLFDNVRAGEDSWAQDMTEAREFYLDKTRKYKYDRWDFGKQYKFTSTSGIDFTLNLEQIMSMYAYSKREQAHDHLMKGGFVFDGNTEVQVNKMGIKVTYLNKTAKAHNVSPEILGEIVSKLTAEQKSFVDEMQEYLSSTMGAKGNEVSMQMYGVELFKEKYYFPLRSAGQYMERAKEADLKKQQGQISIVNSGFTKATTPKSSNPVVLSGFMDVWADHVNEMSMYHSFVLPMEDFRRVYNYSSPNMETGQSISVNSVIQDAYGEAATGYIDQLYRDLNGGAVSDPRENPVKALMGKFKKAAVFASLSVVIQQPSAIARAFAIIDPKYFIGSKVDHKRHKALWAELKKYAPVSVIKEMGYFDTGMGKSAQDFIKGKEYHTIKEKAAALFTDGDYRDELLSKGPALADELTWCGIWEAAKRETKAKNPKMDVRSEEFLQLAGKRFTEVITKTQVYDSVLSRSANMRSKGALMSMWTAFMAEPTTTINMVEDALRKAKMGDKKYAARAFGSVLGSVVLNSLLSSLVYAMRDDDEDETFLEKYVQSFATEILDGLNPLTYYPLLKDIWSALQGYDIERSDMSLITSLIDAGKMVLKVYLEDTEDMDEDELDAHNKRLAEAWWGFADYVTAFTGVPVKNVRRDINGAINTYKTIATDLTDRDTTWGSLLDKTLDAVKNTIPVVGLLSNETAADKLYKATVNGDMAYQKRLASSYATENSLNSAIRKALRAKDSRIWEAAIAWNNDDLEGYMRIAREIVADGNFSQDNVVMAIRAEADAMLPDESESTASKAKGYFTAEKFAVAISQGNSTMAKEIKADIIATAQKNGKTEEEAEKSFASSAKSEMKELFQDESITQKQAISALIAYCGYDLDDAEKLVGEWTFKNMYDFSYDDIDDAFMDGEISAAEARNMYISYGGYSAEDAAKKVGELAFERDYPELSERITYTQYKRWEVDGKPNGVDIEVFTNVAEYRDDGTSNSVKDQEDVAAYINSLSISTAQKDALWCCFWKESTLKKAPWH